MCVRPAEETKSHVVSFLPLTQVIDLRALTSTDADITDADRQQARCALHTAMIDYGFVYVDNHGVPRELLDELMALTGEFFALPQSEKDRFKMDSARSCRGEWVACALAAAAVAASFFKLRDKD